MRHSGVSAAALSVVLAACGTVAPPDPPKRDDAPIVQVFRPMEPIADDADEPLRPEPPDAPGQPEAPLAEAGVCTPVQTIDDRHTGATTFYKSVDGTISFAADMDVNTDGALTSYSASDPGFYSTDGRLNTRRALNTVCNGLKIVGAGAKPDLGPAECPELLRAFERFRDAGWPARNADGDRIRFYGIEARADASGARNEPCLAGDDWMVSQTSIRMTGSFAACDPQGWLDARRVNAIVMPPQVLAAVGASARGGDLAVVRYRGKMFGAIVGDTNPRRVGEGTLALASALRALDPEPPPAPSNIRDVYRLSVKRPPVEYFVFPGTRATAEPITNPRGPELARLALAEGARRGVTARRACSFNAAGARSLNVRRLSPEDGLNDDPDVLKNED
jgi:hypothetical protein